MTLLFLWLSIIIPLSHYYFITFIPISISPESLRWLLVKGKMEEAEKLYTKIARINRKELPEEGLKIDTGADITTRLGDVRDLFKTRSLTKTTLISWVCW